MAEEVNESKKKHWKIADDNLTTFINAQEVDTKWIHIDANGVPCGRLASFIAGRLKGKNNPKYSPHVICGDHVVITNVDKLLFTGKKLQQKKLYSHNQRIGGLKVTLLKDMMQKNPIFVLLDAVKCMLKRTKQRKHILESRLFLYCGSDHQQKAQKPKTISISECGIK